jgi:GR25 family glycosyltransferase involved in LPS biosynthesis
MKAFIISLEDQLSQSLANFCVNSIKHTKSSLKPTIVPATIPVGINAAQIRVFGKQVPWSWPQTPDQSGYDLATGIFKAYYTANDQAKVVACAMSHARMWKTCVELDEPIVILEQDALFIKKFKYNDLLAGDKNFKKGGVCGLNDPRGTTRKAGVFYEKVMAHDEDGVYPAPKVDEPNELNFASGLAGNSAYVIKPWFAQELLDKTSEVGLWPNDAFMCRQLFPGKLRVTKPFYTKVQQAGSTTTQ